MALFKPQNPIAALERELVTLRAKQTTTAERLAQARTAHDAASVKQREMLNSDVFDATKLGDQNAKVWQAATIVSGLETLSTKIAASISNAEQQVAVLRDQAARAREGEIIDKSISTIQTALAGFNKSARALVGALSGETTDRTVVSGVQLCARF